MLEQLALEPAIAGIGTDLLDSSRIERLQKRYGERLAKRILTDAEQSLWHTRGNSSNFLAKQFAAKEALSKALGTGFAQGVSFLQLEVLRNKQGAPVVNLYAKAKEVMQSLGGTQVQVSLSDERHLIFAFAVISR